MITRQTNLDADRDRVLAALGDVLGSGVLCGVDGGPQVRLLEREFTAYVGAGHGVGVSSGSTALLAALGALDVGPGDEVVLPAFTFIADALAVLHRGARPVFADIDPVTYCLDPADLERRLTARTKAVLVVHLFGCPADLGSIQALARTAGAAVVEDCCQAHGATLDGRRVGSFGELACFSFSQGHLVSGGTGGMVLTGDPALAAAVRRLRFFGVSDLAAIPVDDDRDFDRLGFNYGFGELAAAVARVQLAGLEEALAARHRVGEVLAAELREAKELVVGPIELPGRRISHHLVPIRLSESAPFTRDALAAALRSRGVGFLVTYPRPLHHVAVVRAALGAAAGQVTLPVAEAYAGRTLGLFCGGGATARDGRAVAAAIADAAAGLRQPSVA